MTELPTRPVLRIERSGGRALEHPLDGDVEHACTVLRQIGDVITVEPDDLWFVIEQQRR